MSDTNSYSGEDLSDEEEDGEELDPRVNDELEKLNVAANSINHLEAELDEGRAIFRQTMAAATYHLNSHAQKLGKSIEKARPFYDTLREMRRAFHELQVATLQFEKANSRHVYARQRVREAEHKAFSGEKRSFDFALQEVLNQATIEVSEAETMKRESWEAHQKMYKSYQAIQQKAKDLQSKLKKSIEKAKPYFTQKVGFDRHLWHLKLRVDSIVQGLSEAKHIYSDCLKSLELISDDIHQKRKDRKMTAMLAKLHEREAGVGAESSNEDEEASLNQSQLDLDLDCNASLSEVDGITYMPDMPSFSSEGASADDAAKGLGNMSLNSIEALERRVSGAESERVLDSDGPLFREVYGREKDDCVEEEGACSSEEMELKQTEKTEETLADTRKTDAPFKTDLPESTFQESAHDSACPENSVVLKESHNVLSPAEERQITGLELGNSDSNENLSTKEPTLDSEEWI